MFYELAQSRVWSEELFADVGAVFDGETLVFAVDCFGHLVEEHTIYIAMQQFIPATTPDHLDDVPAGATEYALQVLG